MKRINKIVAFALAIILLITGNSSSNLFYAVEAENQSNEIFIGGNGTEESPYEVSNAEQLYAVRYDMEAYYVQTQDIDISEYSNWIPIGNTDNPFRGSYDGNKYTISNLTISEISTDNVGLFGVCSESGILKNIVLDNLKIYDNTDLIFDSISVGGIVGSSYSDFAIDNCITKGNIDVCYLNQDYGFVGGIVGYGTAQNCLNYADISMVLDAVSGWAECGGICGFPGSVSGNIANCVNYGNVVGISSYTIFCGGIAGEDGYIENCINYGDVKASVNTIKMNSYNFYADICAGGIVGISSGEIWNSKNYGNIYSYLCNNTEGKLITPCAGGVAGSIGFYGEGKIGNCYSLGKIIDLKEGEEYIYNVGRIAGFIGGYGQIFCDNYANSSMLVNGDVIEESQRGATTQNGADYCNIILTPSNGTNCFVNTYNEKTSFRLETTGTLEIAKDESGAVIIETADEIYSIYGDGTAKFGKEGEIKTWSELGIEISYGNNYLEITIPISLRGDIEIKLMNDFVCINGEGFNTKTEDGLTELNPWKFYLFDTYNSFSFENYSVDIISKEIISNIFPWGQRIVIYNKKYGDGGLCAGMSIAYAGIEYDDFLGITSFDETAIMAWELEKDKVNGFENISLDEFIQMCHLAQHLPMVNEALKDNASFGNKKDVDNIKALIDSVKSFKNSDGSNPVILSFTTNGYYRAEGASRISYHSVLAYDYLEDENKTILMIYDSNEFGIKKTMEFYKNNGEYTGEWYYTDQYQSCDLKETYITYCQPLETLKQVYYSEDKKNDKYILEIPNNISVEETDSVIKFMNISGDNTQAANVASTEAELYWVEDGTEIFLENVECDEFSLSGDTSKITYKNINAEDVEINVNSQNYSIKTEDAISSDFVIEYEFCNDELNIEKMTIFLDETTDAFSVLNEDKDFHIEGVESIEIVYEERIEGGEGNYVVIKSEEKVYSNLNEKEQYTISFSNEYEPEFVMLTNENDHVISSDDADDIMELLTMVEDGSCIKVNFVNHKILSSEVLSAIQKKNIILIITIQNDKAIWTIDGKNVNTGELYDIDIYIERVANENGNLSTDIIETLSLTREIEQLIFAHNDTFGFIGQLVLDINNISGDKAILLQISTSDSTLKMADTALITDKTVTFEIMKGADSAIVYGYNGDINADNVVTIKDMMLILHSISGRTTLNEVEKGFADVDMSNAVNLQDLMREMRYISGRTDGLYKNE